LAGVPATPKKKIVATVFPTRHVVIEVPTENRIPSEASPLLIRRTRASRSRDRILNWKILCLLMILVFGVLIGIHLLVIECEKKDLKQKLEFLTLFHLL
jgi:hypothetical protein